MARIPDTELQRLKDEVSVQRLVEDAGIALKKAGKDRQPGGEPEQEPVALLRLRYRRWPD
jgi:hypothetical protein